MKTKFASIKDLIQLSEQSKFSICEIMLTYEMETTGRSREEIFFKMENNLEVMEQAIKKGEEGVNSVTGLTGLDAVKLKEYIKQGNSLLGDFPMKAVCYAIATNETNASMGVICASPTAGSAGVIPGVLFALKERLNLTKKQMVEFLITAGAFGFVVANNACISGATGGCQAEIGTASAMAAASMTITCGGSPTQASHAMTIAFKNLLGLVCDPVAGLVEIPCIKRNAIGVVNAITASDMALAGITSRIPCDEVIDAMYEIGKDMPISLRETALGGLAATETGKLLAKQVL